MHLPSISIIIPTLNRSEFLQSALNSLQSQTFADWEAWVVDDGSTDDTSDRVLQIAKLDPRIHYIRRTGEKTGAPVCRNLGTRLSTGRYVIYLDSDDCFAVTALEQRFHCMEEHPDLDFGVFPCILFKQQPDDMKILLNVESDVNDLDRFLSFDEPWQTMCPIWRREAVIKLGLWDEGLLVFQDTELHFRAVAQGLNYRRFDYPDCFWRVLHDGGVSESALLTSRLQSHSRFFNLLIETLKSRDLLTAERCAMLGGLHFFYTNYWSYRGDRTAAHMLWAECYDLHLIGTAVHRMGAFYATLSSTKQLPFVLRRILRRLLREVFKWVWHPKLLAKTSATYHCVPIEPDKIPVVKLRSCSQIEGDHVVIEDRMIAEDRTTEVSGSELSSKSLEESLKRSLQSG